MSVPSPIKQSTNLKPDHQTQPSVATDVADLLMAYLEQMEVDYVFGVPGGAIEPLFNALARSERRGKVRHVLARHEAGAAFMADGYARETGKIGVCCATSGPGATNLITGVACAYDNNIPMLVITGQPPLPSFGRNPLQESACTGININGMFQHCTRYNSLVSHPQQFENKLVTALQRAMHAPRGPVHLSLPIDVFRSPCSTIVPSYDLNDLLKSSAMVDTEALEQLCSVLVESKNIILVIGGACDEAISSILQFADLCGALVLTTPDGKGLVNPSHVLFRGVFGFGGHASADTLLRDPANNLILVVGTSIGEWNTGAWSENLLNSRLVHIDESEEYLSRTPMARLHVRGNIAAVFKHLVDYLHEARQGGFLEYEQRRIIREEQKVGNRGSTAIFAAPHKYESDAVPILPQRLMKELGHLFPVSTRFLADTGNSVSWAVHYLHPTNDRRLGERRLGVKHKRAPGRRESVGGWLRVTMNFAPMGWAIGGAIGTAIANREAPVVCITGDGSVLMNGQEISVAVAEKLTIIFVVLNDQSLGMVKHGQRLAGAEQIGCLLPPTNFAQLGRALGAQAFTIRAPEDFAALDIDALCDYAGPTVLDVYIDSEEVPPMNVRMRVLNNRN